MKTLDTLRIQKKGYGHFRIECEINEEVYSCITTNTTAIDVADDCHYDMEDNSDRYYESQEEAQQALIDEIKRKNYLD